MIVLARVLVAVAFGATTWLGGCDAPSSTASLDTATSLYDRGEYQASLDTAASVASSGSGTTRDRANYLVGLNEYRLGRAGDARRAFEAASASTDADVAGRSLAMLGTLDMDARRYADAERAFRAAAQRLTGEEAARATRQAESARAAATGTPGTLPAPVLTSPGGSGAGGKATASPRGWTIQLGVFKDLANAQRVALEANRSAAAKDIGAAQVVPVRDAKGTISYVVRLGTFSTRRAADDAKRRLGRLDSWVTALDD